MKWRYHRCLHPVLGQDSIILSGNRTLFAMTIIAIDLLEMLNWQNLTVIDNTWPKVKNSITINNKVCR
jgi:hypothetical protein